MAKGKINNTNKSRKKRIRELPEKQPSKSIWQKPWFLITSTCGLVVVVAIGILLIVLFAPTPLPLNTPAPSFVTGVLANISINQEKAIGSDSLPPPLEATPSQTPSLQTSANLPELYYIGSNACPYCAAERWSLVIALDRFGSFQNLKETSSLSTDIYPSTNSLSFYGSTYQSKYLSFISVELYTSTNTTLESPNSTEENLLSTFDIPPYAPSSGGIPFLDLGGQYVVAGSGFSPSLLQGLSQTQIANDLKNPTSADAKAIIGNANYLTAGICKITNNAPASVCKVSPITSLLAS